MSDSSDFHKMGMVLDPFSASMTDASTRATYSTGDLLEDSSMYDSKSTVKEAENTEIEAAQTAKVAAAKLVEDEALRKRRNSMFQTDGGAEGDAVMNVGSRDTYYGN